MCCQKTGEARGAAAGGALPGSGVVSCRTSRLRAGQTEPLDSALPAPPKRRRGAQGAAAGAGRGGAAVRVPAGAGGAAGGGGGGGRGCPFRPKEDRTKSGAWTSCRTPSTGDGRFGS